MFEEIEINSKHCSSVYSGELILILFAEEAEMHVDKNGELD